MIRRDSSNEDSEAGQEPENTCGKRRKARQFEVDEVTERLYRGNSEADDHNPDFGFEEKMGAKANLAHRLPLRTL
jgi:hypothetical protein